MKITQKWLKSNYACGTSIGRFERLFGDSAEVTAENVKRWRDASSADGFGGQDPGYIAYYALGASQRLTFSFNQHVGGGSLATSSFLLGQYSDERCAEALRQVLHAVDPERWPR